MKLMKERIKRLRRAFPAETKTLSDMECKALLDLAHREKLTIDKYFQ